MHEESNPAGAGWYPDPWVTGQQRYWTGEAWSADVFPDGLRQAPDPRAAAYGREPTQHASPPPAPPSWEAPRSEPAPGIPEAAPPATPPAPPSPKLSGRTLAAVIGGLCLALILLLLAGVWLRRDSSEPAAAPRPSPSPTAPQFPTPEPTSPAPTDSGRGETSPQPAPSGSAAPAPSPPAEPTPQGSVSDALAALVLQQRDVLRGIKVATIPGGDTVEGQATLDLCGSGYPSEDLRVGRLQVAANNRKQVFKLSTEAVQYSSAQASDQALEEVRQRAESCQANISIDGLEGTAISTSLEAGADEGWPVTPGVDRVAVRITETDLVTGEKRQKVAVYLSRGPLFMGLYFPTAQRRQISVEGHTSMPSIVRVFEKRLLDTPPGESSTPPGGGGSQPDNPLGGGGSDDGVTA